MGNAIEAIIISQIEYLLDEEGANLLLHDLFSLGIDVGLLEASGLEEDVNQKEANLFLDIARPIGNIAMQNRREHVDLTSRKRFLEPSKK